jgi:hypothetical protein
MGRRACGACGWVMWVTALTACSPALDWRAVRPEESGAVALFPCRPTSQARRLHLGAVDTEMFIYACTASGATFALGYADVADPAQVAPALAALRTAAIANVSGNAQAEGELSVKGMTPNSEARRLRIVGHLPGGREAQMSAGFFAKGTRVFQASVIAPAALGADAVNTFFAGLEVPS